MVHYLVCFGWIWFQSVLFKSVGMLSNPFAAFFFLKTSIWQKCRKKVELNKAHIITEFNDLFPKHTMVGSQKPFQISCHLINIWNHFLTYLVAHSLSIWKIISFYTGDAFKIFSLSSFWHIMLLLHDFNMVDIFNLIFAFIICELKLGTFLSSWKEKSALLCILECL